MKPLSPVRLCICLVFLVMCIGNVSAVTIQSYPDRVAAGDRITVDIAGLNDGALFSILIGGDLAVQADGRFSLIASDFVLPLTLRGGEISAYAEYTAWTRLSVKKGSTTVSASGDSVDGIFQTSEARNVTAGTYEILSVQGIAAPGASRVIARIQMTGIKEGPHDSRLSFVAGDIGGGTIRVQIRVDGSEIMDKVVTVTPPASSQESASGGGSGISTPTITTIPATHTEGFNSPDGIVTVLTQGESVGIQPVEGAIVSDGWRLVTLSYRLTPERLDLASPAILSFRIPAGIHSPLFLASRDEEGEWRMLPSQITGDIIRAEIHQTGIYGLMTLGEDVSEGVTETRSASIPASPTPTLAAPAVIVGSLSALVFIGFRHRRM